MKPFIDHKIYRIKIYNIIKYNENTSVIEVRITHRKKGLIGHGSFSHNKKLNKIMPGDVFIREQDQRKGLGNAMYSFVERFNNAKMVPSKRQSVDAINFWNQKKRPFG